MRKCECTISVLVDDDDLYHCIYGQSLVGHHKQIYKRLVKDDWYEL